MDIKNILGAGGIGTGFALVADVLFTGGDFLFWAGEFLIAQGPLIYVLLSRLMVLAPDVSWLPEGSIQLALQAGAVVVVAIYGYRLIKRAVRSWSNRNET